MAASTREPVYCYIGDFFYPVPQFPLAVVGSEIRQAEPMHTHDFAEIVFVREGSGSHIAEGETTGPIVEGGDVLLIAQGERHAYTNAHRLKLDNLLYRHDLFAGPTRVAVLDAFAVIEPLFRLPVNSRIVHLPPTARERVRGLLDDLRRELTERKPGFHALALARFVECIVIVGRVFVSEQARHRTPREVDALHTPVAASVEFMRLHFPEALTMADIAATANLAPHHFSEVFKKSVGVSPWRFLLGLRLDHAAYLLTSQPGMPIAHVAAAAGFGDPAYFARAFRAANAVSPSRYRAANSGG